MSNVRIVLTGHGRGEVFVDGQKIKGVKAVSVSAAVETMNTVTLQIGAEQVEIDGLAVVDVTDIGHGERQLQRVA